MTTILIVVSHPDDAEIAMGMRMLAHARSGARVHVHCLTTGHPSNAPDRLNERRAAGKLLGVSNYTFSAIPDTRSTDHRGAINAALINLFSDTRPDIIFTHYPADQHLDHATTGTEATAVTLRGVANLRYFRSPYSIGFEPTLFFMGNADLLRIKAKALDCFSSQQQLDMNLYQRLAEVTYRQHLHHRVVEQFPPEADCAELFLIARQIEFVSTS
ncbi:PIG-L family deacetylase [Actinomadura darangshiensis]|uniref:PIG-L family deacetylase n=1 Tax=Actinomadura darangshiensis TaxID=705336 RepID=A0A4R4ZSD8_9ACTN|nr:PIG-L family deacetylase [Actinomadura darangshiensis]TDD61943.1 PIG-L family deacetylase [Actinomadura darangshiensis]